MSTSESKLQDAESNAAASKTLEDQPQSDSASHSDEKSSEEASLSGKISESGGGDEGGEDIEEEEEEEGECGFCLFMKGGGCRDSFIAWEKCIEEAEKNKEDIVEKCFEVTGALKKCMEAHPDYYEPILKAEKMAEEEAIIELEKEIAPSASQEDTNSDEQKASAGGK
ncbi:uncharacterized protein LOC103489149 [Cucumis melo]|uniref:Uncharacterized protein LOC103489149 n=1 Tax=Cucumis melo TaxID=3656 RepID=A0A1S3BFM8_CUCME|nr:uncharacterized protein LOC103489149 [Cucumis melo]